MPTRFYNPEESVCTGCRKSISSNAESTTDLKRRDWHMECADAALATCREGTGHRLLKQRAREMGLRKR